MTDKSAEKAETPNWGVEGLSAVGVAVLAASAQVEAVRKLAGDLGEYSSAVSVVLLLGVMLWCIAIVSGKSQSRGAEKPNSGPVYTYSQFLRILAKIGLVGGLLLVPFRLYALADDLRPIPDTIYGILYKGGSEPVDGAHLRLTSSSGEELTSPGDWLTDSAGFYKVCARRRLRRSDVIKVVPQGCKSEQTLSLARVFQAAPDVVRAYPQLNGVTVAFIHHVNCEAP